MIFMTSDQHWAHANIIKFCDRPFANVYEMDEEMIRCWNNVVGADDCVYHLGDVTLGEDVGKYLRRLNGRISVLATWWHHDKRWLARVRESVFDFGNIDIRSMSGHPIRLLPPMYLLQPPGIPPITLSHYPMFTWERSHYSAYHCFGHTHGRYISDGLAVDVGVDANEFYPVSLDEVVAYMKREN